MGRRCFVLWRLGACVVFWGCFLCGWVGRFCAGVFGVCFLGSVLVLFGFSVFFCWFRVLSLFSRVRLCLDFLFARFVVFDVSLFYCFSRVVFVVYLVLMMCICSLERGQTSKCEIHTFKKIQGLIVFIYAIHVARLGIILCVLAVFVVGIGKMSPPPQKKKKNIRCYKPKTTNTILLPIIKMCTTNLDASLLKSATNKHQTSR